MVAEDLQWSDTPFKSYGVLAKINKTSDTEETLPKSDRSDKEEILHICLEGLQKSMKKQRGTVATVPQPPT
jgi:hypothetical protein